MKHPIVLIIPALMLCEYYLAIIRYILRERNYGNHVKIGPYKLNPAVQSRVNRRRKWFNIRHLILTALVTLFAIFFSEDFVDIPAGVKIGIFGGVVVFFSAVIGMYLSDILIFRYSIKHPDEISGEIQVSSKRVLKSLQYQTIAGLFPFLIVIIFVRTPFTIGGLAGLVFYQLFFSVAIGEHEKQKGKEANSNQTIE
jgi:hypothetical protein